MATILEQINQIKSALIEKRATHEQAIIEIDKEIEALSVLEHSKHLNIDEVTNNLQQENLFPKLTIKDRMTAALSNMPSIFTRNELLEAVNKDGHPKEVKESTFSVFFAEFVNDKKVIECGKVEGGRASLYTLVNL